MKIPSVSFTPASNYQEALSRAAALWGIEPGYWDIWGEWHQTSSSIQSAILESLGVASGSLDDLDAAVENRLRLEWTALTPPVHVVSESETPPEIPVRIPLAAGECSIRVELEWEDGWIGIVSHRLAELETVKTAEIRGRHFIEKRLPLTASPLGYHCLRVHIEPQTGPEFKSETRLIVTPDRAYLPPEADNKGRLAGLNVSLYGIGSQRSWGCGDFTDLKRLAAWVGEHVGGSFITLNPLHAIHNRQPFNTSPYLPNCIFYKNLIYLDVEQIEDFSNSSWASALRSSSAVENEIRELNESQYVEYERVYRLKRAFGKLCFRSFLEQYRNDTPRSRQFRRFVETEGELLDRYAVHCALDEWIHRQNPSIWNWPSWPEPYQDPASDATREFASKHWRSVLFHKYIQWQIDLQLAEAQATARQKGLSIGLFHDLALATDRYGSDLWAHRQFFVPGCRVGAPPDDFSPKGQDWSFPPPNSGCHWENGYRLFTESISKNCRHGGALRIDHVMRFFRLFWIPPGKEAADGTYIRDLHENLVRILALESVRNKVLIVGEDLGTVDPETRKILARFGILSYRLFYFEKNQHGEFRLPADYPVQALVSSTTHDLPTLAGFWCGSDIEARRASGILPDTASYNRAIEHRNQEKQKMLDVLFHKGLLPDWVPPVAEEIPELTGELHNAVTGFLASTPSLLLALNQEDLTKETEQQNLPGTTAEYPNWRRKMRYRLEELESSEEVGDFVRMFRHWLDKTGRTNRKNRSTGISE